MKKKHPIQFEKNIENEYNKDVRKILFVHIFQLTLINYINR